MSQKAEMEAVQEIFEGRAEIARLRDENAWLRAQVERLTSAPTAFHFDTVPPPVCAHQWMTDTAGTRCAKCGKHSVEGYGWPPPWQPSGATGVSTSPTRGEG